MECPKCHHVNKPSAKFCASCGTKLQRLCSKCGSEVDPEDRFCSDCGAPLTEATPIPEPFGTGQRQGEEEDQALPDAERRQLTVMFCDLVGSTQLSQQLDPEELRNVVQDYQSVCAKVISRFEGHIAQYLGDGLLVYFGYPQAHEDDAGRAVRAGLGITEAVEQLSARLQQSLGVDLSVRVGVHTGMVVVGEIGEGDSREQLALGETPNLAARLEGLAPPNGVVVSADTYGLIEGYFNCQDMGKQSLKGITQTMEVYQVLHESAARSRFEVSALSGLTPLVGREKEVGLLLGLWEQALGEMGQVVLLSGEAGIGKSRLVQVFKEHVAGDPQAWLTECQCSPYHQSSAFYPIIDLLERVVLQFERDDSEEDRLSKLEGFLVQYGFSLEDAMPLFTSLLSLPLPERYPPLTLMSEMQKGKTMEAILAALMKRSEQQPVLFVVEDLHWIDPSTLELISLLIDREPTTRILILLTYRPDFSPPWVMHGHLTLLALSRLSRRQIVDMVRKMAGGKALPSEVVEQVVSKTDGVPLFVEELTKMVMESGLLNEREDHYELSGPLPPLAIPTTLQDSLMARLDRLATVKEVAQLGATIGREFSYELLQAASVLGEESLGRELSRLVEAEIIYQRGLPPQAIYLFKHALIQEAAYQSLLKITRGEYHQRIAQVLEKKFPETVETQPELLAHHYTEADLIEEAIPYWYLAGQEAIKRSANLEAISHLSKGLELLKNLPEGAERVEQEINMQIVLGGSLMATKGYGVPEVEEAFSRARQLCQQIGETSQLFQALRGLCLFYLVQPELKAARELGEQCLRLAKSLRDPAFLIEAHRVLLPPLFCLGEFTLVQEHSAEGINLYELQQHRSLAFLYGVDPGVVCLSYGAWTLWVLGFPDQALDKIHAALKLAGKLSNPFSLGLALSFAGKLHQFCREVGATQEQAEAAIILSTEPGFAIWLAYGTVLSGWVLAEQGEIEEGVGQIRQGMAAWRDEEGDLFRPFFLGLLAEVYGKAVQTEEGLKLLTEALATVEVTSERWYEAELYRLKGELLLSRGDREPGSRGASSFTPAPPHLRTSAQNTSAPPHLRTSTQSTPEECFHKAIEVARRQEAKSLELRAAMSLSRLWKSQGKKEEARKLLGEVYGWFTEGYDTKDLKEAKTLLEELS